MWNNPRISCEGKVKHKTQKDALSSLKRKRQKKKDLLNMKIIPYKCEFCGFWHVGHTINKQKGVNNEQAI